MYVLFQNNIITNDIVNEFKINGIVEEKKSVNSEGNLLDAEYVLQGHIVVDKKELILRGIKKAEIYMSTLTSQQLQNRIYQNSTADLSETNSSNSNSSILNSDLLRLNSLRNYFNINNGLNFVNQVDLSFSIDADTIKKIKNDNVSDGDAFGYIEKFEIDVSPDSNIPNNKKNKKNTDFFKYNLQEKTNRTNQTGTTSLMRTYNNSGINYIAGKNSSLEKFIKQEKFKKTSIEKNKGTFRKNFYKKEKLPFYNNFIDNLKADHSTVAKEFFNQSSNQSLRLKKIVNRYQSQTFNIEVKKENLTAAGQITFVLVLYDEKNLRQEIKFFDFKVQENMFSYNYPDNDFEFDVIKLLKNKFIGKITNNSKKNRSYQASYVKHQKIKNNDIYDKPKTLKTIVNIGPGKTESFKFELSEYSSYLFFANILYSGQKYNNAKFGYYSGKKTLIHSTHEHVNMNCLNVGNSLTVNINNIKNNIAKIILFKRNVTKKEKTYKQIESFLNPFESVQYIDLDVEDKDVYEYCVEKIYKNGFKTKSSNTLMEKYCISKKLGDITASIINLSDGLPQTNKRYQLEVNYERRISNVDKVFKSLTGNYYNLFEEKLKDVNDQNSIVFDVDITAYRQKTGETIQLGNIQLDEKETGNLLFELPGDLHLIKVSPRVELPSVLLSIVSKRRRRGSDTTITSNQVLADDIFENKETGDIAYAFVGSSNSGAFSFSNASILKVENNLKRKNKKENVFDYNKEEKYYAFFKYFDPNNTINYFITSYAENNNSATLYEIASPSASEQLGENLKNFNFIYSLPQIKGKIVFIAQPVLKDGSVLSPFIIGNISNA